MEISKQAVQGAVSEIESLRRQNELMSARLDMFDKMILLFTSEPSFPRTGAAPDLVYELRKYIAVAEEKEKQSA